MKKVIFSLFTVSAILLTGCLETIQEITLNVDGTGTYVNTNDMGKIIGIAKNFGMASGDKLPQESIDTSFSIAALADSMTKLTQEEKEMMKKGSLHLSIDMGKEVFVTKMSFPFTSLDEIQMINKLSGKLMMETMNGQMPSELPMGMGALPEQSSFDDYYSVEFSNGEIKKKLDKKKYAEVDKDEYLNGLKQAGAMGIPVISTFIINLPRPAEKAEGKNLKLSDDKMKVTVLSSMDDFFDNPESLEFKIKY